MNKSFKYLLKQKEGRGSVLTGVLLASVLALFSCSQPSRVSESLELSQNQEQLLAPNISLQISYDQTSTVVTPFWPEDAVAGFKGKAVSGDTEMLIDYDRTREYIAIKDDKTMYLQVDYLEGTRSQGMPDDLYNEVKDDMPYRDRGKQIVGTRIGDGQITYIHVDGSETSESVDASELALTDEVYEHWRSLFENRQDTSVSATVARNLGQLEQSGISYRQLDASTVYFELQPDADEQPDIGLTRQKMDLKTGDIVMSSTQFKDGRYESVSYMGYRQVGSISVLENSETYVFGSYNGQWQAVQKHLVDRENITIATNF